jgi:hypothetical protein
MEQYLIRNPQGCCSVVSFPDEASVILHRDNLATLWSCEVPFLRLGDAT